MISFQDRGFYIATGGGSTYQSWTHLRQVMEDRGFDVQLTDRSHQTSLLSLQGPRR